jgi:hypothetical protein
MVAGLALAASAVGLAGPAQAAPGPVTVAGPTVGPLVGGTVVSLSGVVGASASSTTVTFGGVPATHVQVMSPSWVRATTPAVGTPKTVSVIVTTHGSSSAAGPSATYRYAAKPKITSMTPNVVAFGDTTQVVVQGSDLDTTTGATVNGGPVPFTVLPGSLVRVTVPGTADGTDRGPIPVVLTARGGTATSAVTIVDPSPRTVRAVLTPIGPDAHPVAASRDMHAFAYQQDLAAGSRLWIYHDTNSTYTREVSPAGDPQVGHVTLSDDGMTAAFTATPVGGETSIEVAETGPTTSGLAALPLPSGGVCADTAVLDPIVSGDGTTVVTGCRALDGTASLVAIDVATGHATVVGLDPLGTDYAVATPQAVSTDGTVVALNDLYADGDFWTSAVVNVTTGAITDLSGGVPNTTNVMPGALSADGGSVLFHGPSGVRLLDLATMHSVPAAAQGVLDAAADRVAAGPGLGSPVVPADCTVSTLAGTVLGGSSTTVGSPQDGRCAVLAFSADGHWLAFTTDASNIVANSTRALKAYVEYVP